MIVVVFVLFWIGLFVAITVVAAYCGGTVQAAPVVRTATAALTNQPVNIRSTPALNRAFEQARAAQAAAARA